MNKLTKDNIAFIDNYLSHSGIKYLDIKLEILDHVATGIEEDMQATRKDFYQAFKDFMMLHKKELLQWSENTIEKGKKLVFLKVLKNLKAIDTLIFGSILFVILKQYPSMLSQEILTFFPMVVALVFVISYFGLFYNFKKLAIAPQLLMLAGVVYYTGTFALFLSPILFMVFMTFEGSYKNWKSVKIICCLLLSVSVALLDLSIHKAFEFTTTYYSIHFLISYACFKTLISCYIQLRHKHRDLLRLTR
jgi:hypothetical protein